MKRKIFGFRPPQKPPELTRWIFPETPEEEAVAKKVDAFFLEHFPENIVPVDSSYRVSVALPFHELNKSSTRFFSILYSIFSSDDPISAFFDVVGNYYLETACATLDQLIDQVQKAVPTDQITYGFLIEYVYDILLVQVPYNTLLNQYVLAEIYLKDIQLHSLSLTTYNVSRDPRMCSSSNRTFGTLSFDFSPDTSSLLILYANISLADALLITSTHHGEDGNPKVVCFQKDSVVLSFTESGGSSTYLLAEESNVPVSCITKLNIGLDT